MARKHTNLVDPKYPTPSGKLQHTHTSGDNSGIVGISSSSEPEIGTKSVPQRQHRYENANLVSGSTLLQETARPKIEQQISVLSTDSGFLPRDIQDSSFVDDVIEELNSKGISHSDIISFQDCHASSKEVVASPKEILSTGTKHTGGKQRSRRAGMQDVEGPSRKKAITQKTSGHQPETNCDRREKNNAASRKSRASRKMNTLMKEKEIAALQEDNQRLLIILQDFTSIAVACKQWIVQKMDNPDS